MEDNDMGLKFDKFEPSSEKKASKIDKARPVASKRMPTYTEMLEAPPAGIFEVRVGQAAYMRQAANGLFEEDKIDDAMKLYERALLFLNFDKAEMKFELTDEHRKSVHSNTNT
jgi:hypothetical protein